MIQVNSISRRYGDFTAVDDVSFSINAGEIVGLLGHNGAGKTTIMKILTGYIEPDAGSISINDLALEDKPNDIQQLIGYLPENLPVYPELTVMDYLFYCAKMRNIESSKQQTCVLAAIKKTGLSSKALQAISSLSRGFKQRVGVAQALIHNPKILILDEPTNGLDPQQTNQMRELIRSLANHATVIISTHIMQEVSALCDRVLILDNGQLAINQTMEELTRSDTVTLTTGANEENVNAHLAGFYLQHKIADAPPAQLMSNGEKTNTFHLSVTKGVTTDKLCSWMTNQLINDNEDVFAIHPLQQDLETVFRTIHEVKNSNDREIADVA